MPVELEVLGLRSSRVSSGTSGLDREEHSGGRAEASGRGLDSTSSSDVDKDEVVTTSFGPPLSFLGEATSPNCSTSKHGMEVRGGGGCGPSP